ncbi:hypothetical protein ABPG74_013263 [Tetrahymena malaccensis]
MDKVPCDPNLLENYKNEIMNSEIDTETKRRIICQIKIWTSLNENPPIQLILESDIIQALLLYSEDELCDPKMQFDIVWIFGNICSCSSDEVKYMLTLGVDDFFIEHLENQITQIVELAMWGLGNIAGDNPKSRDVLLFKEIIPKLVKILNSVDQKKNLKEAFFQTFCWLISQLVRGKPSAQPQHISEILPIFRELLFLNKRYLYPDILWGLSYITDEDETVANLISDSPIFDKLTELIDLSFGFTINHPSIRIIANLASSSENITDKLINSGLIQHLIIHFLEYNPEYTIIRKEVCWCLSNIAAGTLQQAKSLITMGEMTEKLKRLLRYKKDPEVQKETMWIITNLSNHQDSDIFKYLLGNDIFAVFTTEINQGDKKMIELFLQNTTSLIKFLNKASKDTFTAQELEKLVLLLHYIQTTIQNIKPMIVTGQIRQQCKDIKDSIQKINKKFNLPQDLEQKVLKN